MKTEESEIITDKNEDKNHSITAIQNNFNFVQNINLQDLTILSQNNPELAERYIKIVEKSQDEIQIVNKEIIELEKNEQKIRANEIPYLRKYTFRGQLFAFIISILGLVTSALFAYLNLPWQAIVAPITIPIGILAIKFLGEKSDKKDKTNAYSSNKPLDDE